MAILTVPTHEAFRAFFAAYGFDFPGRATARGLEVGTVNTSFAVTADDARYFLRIYEEQEMAGALAEARLLEHLAENAVPTPSPIPGSDGRVVRMLAGKPAALFPWIDGTMLCQKSVTPESARLVGRALACIHRVGPAPGASQGSSLGSGRFGEKELLARCDRVALSQTLANDPEASVLAGKLRDAVVQVSARRATNLPSGLVHADLFRDNVLWQDGNIRALLDFESAHIGPFVFDLAVTLLSWSFDDTFVPAIARAIAAGYREERTIEAVERRALFDEARFASLRFTITRITDETIRVGKRWQRFAARSAELERLGPDGFSELVGL